MKILGNFMSTVITWASIGLLHNVVKTLQFLAALPPQEGQQTLPQVHYRAKVKLHGMNCAVQIHDNGIVAQSRETILTPEADLKGFAKWAYSHESVWRSLPSGIVVFGEWCGPGVEPGMAVSNLPTKIFAVFGIQIGTGENAKLVYDPAGITAILAKAVIPLMYVLPWMAAVDFTVDFADAQSLQDASVQLNGIVQQVEQEDPWVKEQFNVSGLGEGIVLYPVSWEDTNPESFAKRMFKAKGEKHRTVRTKDAVQVNPEAAQGVTEFVNLVLTPARLEQGVSKIGGREPKLTGKFLQWIVADVQKETAAELAASGLTWGQVQPVVQRIAREWFLK
jgi:hypothetical protein